MREYKNKLISKARLDEIRNCIQREDSGCTQSHKRRNSDKENLVNHVKAVILTGGQNKRIGRNKAFLDIGNMTLIECIVDKVNKVFEDVCIVTNSSSEYKHLSIKCIEDILPHKGPLGGIYTGMEFSEKDYIFVFACDMPFLSVELIKYMIGKTSKRFDAIVPMFNQHPEPLHSIYSKGCKEVIKRRLLKNELCVNQIFETVDTLFIAEDLSRFGENPLFDIDTMEDYKKVEFLSVRRWKN